MGDWFRDAFTLSRNNYDRLGHFVQGLVPAILIREILLRRTALRPGGWLFVRVSRVCLTFSACFEFIEWWSALALGAAADAFLTTQGDVWDTRWDMCLCLLGAILAQLLLAHSHDHHSPQSNTKPYTEGEGRELCECRCGAPGWRTATTLTEFTTHRRLPARSGTVTEVTGVNEVVDLARELGKSVLDVNQGIIERDAPIIRVRRERQAELGGCHGVDRRTGELSLRRPAHQISSPAEVDVWIKGCRDLDRSQAISASGVTVRRGNRPA